VVEEISILKVSTLKEKPLSISLEKKAA